MQTLRAAIVLAASVVVLSADVSTAQTAGFPSVVRKILDSQTEGRLASMGADKRLRMTDCVIASLNGLPSGKKRFIVEGANLEEQEHRFGQVVDEDNAKWRQNIARACASIALSEDRSN